MCAPSDGRQLERMAPLARRSSSHCLIAAELLYAGISAYLPPYFSRCQCSSSCERMDAQVDACTACMGRRQPCARRHPIVPFMRWLLLIPAVLLEVLKVPHLRIATICMGSAFLKGRTRLCLSEGAHARACKGAPLSATRPTFSCGRPHHAASTSVLCAVCARGLRSARAFATRVSM